jgi:hypothetical protein
MRLSQSIIAFVFILCVTIYPGGQVPWSLKNPFSECILFGRWPNSTFHDKNGRMLDGRGHAADFCDIINEFNDIFKCNEIFIGTIIHDSSYSIIRDSIQNGVNCSDQYEKYNVRIDSVLIGQAIPGNVIDLIFDTGTTYSRKCRIFVPSKGDSLEGDELVSEFLYSVISAGILRLENRCNEDIIRPQPDMQIGIEIAKPIPPTICLPYPLSCSK